MLSCRELTDLVDEYIDGRLGIWDRLRFQFHIRMCPICHDYIEQVRMTRSALGRLPEPEMPEEVQREMLAHFRSWRRATPEGEAGPGGAPESGPAG